MQQRRREWTTIGSAARACLTALAAAASLLPGARTSEARLHRATQLDSDVGAAAMTIIGEVTSFSVVKKRAPGPFGSLVELRELRVRVVVPVTNARVGQVVKVRHPRLLPKQPPSLNGFGPAVLEQGKTYLLFLKARQDGRHELLTVEDASLVAFSGPVLAKIARGKSKAPPVERVVDALAAVVAGCNDDCMGAIWLLDRSQIFARRLKAVPGRRRAFIGDLLRVTRRSKDDNTLNAAYTVLGRLGVRSVVPAIVAHLCRKPQDPRAVLGNAVSWLQGFPRQVEIKALQQVIARAADPGVIRAAKYRLGWLTKH